MLRLFIAIEIPAEIKSQISSLIQDLKASNADVRWEQVEKLHITLKFLGDTEEELLPKIVLLLDEVAAKSSRFSLTYSGLGCFPNKREPRIIWVGTENRDGVLLTIDNSIEDAMASLGFEKEKRAFHAHVTIGRVKSQRYVRDLLRRMESTTLVCNPVEVSQIMLMESKLKPSGSLYTTVKEFRLGTTRI